MSPAGLGPSPAVAARSASFPSSSEDRFVKKTLSDLPDGALAAATVALRADFNVPLNHGRITDATRIKRTVPTIEHLAEAGARVVLLSHLGRPGGRVRPTLTLKPAARCLDDLLQAPVRFCPHNRGPSAFETIAAMDPGSVLLLENTRFLAGETDNDSRLAADWATWADHFVLDGFGTAHRAHASTDGLPRAVKAKGGEAVAGFLTARELAVIHALEEPRRPFVAVIGGAKISGKIDVIEALLPRIDALLVGGAMANTFFRAMGMETGASLVECGSCKVATQLMEAAGPRLVLPVDCTVARSVVRGVGTRAVNRSEVASGEVIGDIGPVSVQLFSSCIEGAATLVWNGPMGAFEVAGFADGTRGVAAAAAAAADKGATVFMCGGDSAAAARDAGVAARITHISTGGGASLDLLAGKELPGVAALSDRRSA